MRKALASITLALTLSIPGLASAPTAAATPTNTNHTSITRTNWDTFKKGRGSYFSITVKMTPCRNCAGIPGKAQLKLDGKHQRFRKLDHGSITFHIPRSKLRNNRWVEVAVRTWPRSDNRPSQVVKFDVRDTVKKKKHRAPSSKNAGDRVMNIARQQLGKPYKWGAAGPGSYDCSGLVVYAYRIATGKRLPHYSGSLRNAGRVVPRSEARRGAIVWTPGHVSLYAGNGVVIEAVGPGTRVRRVSMWQKNATFIQP
jgi:cell wall-associated NlpC family hydrolase